MSLIFPRTRLNTLKSLCSFHNACISLASPASFNTVHYWNEYRKPITRVATGAGHVPNLAALGAWFPVEVNKNPHAQPSASPVLKLLGATLMQPQGFRHLCSANSVHVCCHQMPREGGPGVPEVPSQAALQAKQLLTQWLRAQTLRIPEFESRLC